MITSAPAKDPMADLLRNDEALAIESFTGSMQWQSEEQLAHEAKREKKKGRLGRMTFEFTTADVLNDNRRIYPTEVFKLALSGLNERIGNNKVFGNLDHPSIWDPDSLIVKLSDAAVKIVEATMKDETDLKLVLDILDNKHGQQLVSVLEAGGDPGVSQRAIAQWRDPSEAERERFKVPENEFVQVAEVLRLITYDVVSEPGFPDADGARVTEHRTGDSPMLTKDEIKKQAPSAYDAILEEGRASAATNLQSAVESAIAERKPQIVEEALKPVQEELAAEQAKVKELTDQLAAVKPALVSLGIVNEQITDAEAAAQVATAKAEVTSLEEKNASLTAENKSMQEQITKHKAVEQASEVLRVVSQQFKDHPQHDLIITEVAKKGFTDATKALEGAQAVADFIKRVNPASANKDDENSTPAGNGNAGENAQPMQSVLAGLLKSNSADPANANGARANKGAGDGIGSILTSELPGLL